MKITFDDTREQDLMTSSVKQHIIHVANKLPTMPRTVDGQKKDMNSIFYELKDWVGIYQSVWSAEIKESDNE